MEAGFRKSRYLGGDFFGALWVTSRRLLRVSNLGGRESEDAHCRCKLFLHLGFVEHRVSTFRMDYG